MIVWSTLSNSITLYLFGNVLVDYAIWVGFLSSLAIIVTLSLVNLLIRIYKRPSIIVFILATVQTMATFTIPFSSVK